MSKNKLEPSVILTLDIYNLSTIPLIVITSTGDILQMTEITKSTSSYYIRKRLLGVIDNLIKEYSVDTILLEQNKLFIDKIDRYPDPFVLNDIMLGFGITISIQDKYFDTIKYIIALPDYEWKKKVLNKNVKYAIDLYKAHVLDQNLSTKALEQIDNHNYYKAICLSYSVLFDDLMNQKYQINKGDN